MQTPIRFFGMIWTAASTSFVFVSGCSGSYGDSLHSDAGANTTSTPVQDDEKGAPSAVGTTGDPSGPPASAAGARLPKKCTSEADCAGACPRDAKGCTCADTPEGRLCIPTCDTDEECPILPERSLVCSAQKICTPKQ
jgi:hypothetical protein